jgi:ABC-type spermidine/putrescine transport system permease subunit II
MAKAMDRLETMPVSRRSRATRNAFRLWALLVFFFLYVPIAFLVLFSFEDSRTPGLPFTGFTLDWYASLPENSQLIGAVANSIIIAVVVAVVATLVGTMAAFPLVRGGIRWPNAARVVFTMPIMLPGILIGVGLVVFLAGTLEIQLSQMTVIAGHLVLTMPFVILIVAARLQGFDRRLEWAAADLGASPARVVRLIVLPLIAPAVLAGALISITLSIDEFVVTFFTVGSQLTLPIYIYTQIKFGVTPEVNAVATLVMVGTILVLGLITLVATRGRRAGRAVIRRVRGGA